MECLEPVSQGDTPMRDAIYTNNFMRRHLVTKNIKKKSVPIFLSLYLLIFGSIAHAQLTVYTDRTQWEAAVATAGTTAQFFDFTGLGVVYPDFTGANRVTQLDTNYDSRFRIVVDRVSAITFRNPGIDIFPDANCSLGVGDCNVFTLNIQDPDSSFDGPRINQLILPKPIIAFGGDYIQVGVTAPPPGNVTGPVSLQFGSDTITLNDYMGSGGNGFLGFVATVPSDTISFTFSKSGTISNDIFNIYNPAFAFAPVTPAQMISDLGTLVQSFNLMSGISNSLTVKLDAALSLQNAGDTVGACTKLTDFIAHANAQKGKHIPTAQANQLILEATDVKIALGCS
jgi:hypothetical protein